MFFPHQTRQMQDCSPKKWEGSTSGTRNEPKYSNINIGLIYNACNAQVQYCRLVTRVADVPGRKHLRSAASSSLAILATRCSTIGDCAFAVASVWNKLPQEIRSATSLVITCFQTSIENSSFRLRLTLVK